MGINFRLIGFVGLMSNSLLALITIWRTFRWYDKWELPQTWTNYTFRKKFLFHILLLLTALSDIPMYISFITTGGYTLTTYSFHKFESTFLFAALSITISDWSAVLHDIHEYQFYSFLFGRATLITINLVYLGISLANFVLCYSLSDLDTYTASPIYVCAIFFQITMNMLLTCFMLHAGLKLYSRIHGAVGNLDQTNHGTTTHSANTSARSSARSTMVDSPVASNGGAVDGNAELKNALTNLNLVMATCTLCILLQMVMLILNYAMGYANDAGRTVGPADFYWACTSWIPLWGPVVTLLYLSRTHSQRKKAKFNSTRLYSNDGATNGMNGQQAFSSMHSPLIGTIDYSQFTDSENGNSTSRSALQARLLAAQRSNGTMGASDFSRSLLDRMDTVTSGTTETEPMDEQHLLYSPDNSLQYRYRDTHSTTVSLPSDLIFPNNIMRVHTGGVGGRGGLNVDDFSYRGEEELNGQYN